MFVFLYPNFEMMLCSYGMPQKKHCIKLLVIFIPCLLNKSGQLTKRYNFERVYCISCKASNVNTTSSLLLRFLHLLLRKIPHMKLSWHCCKGGRSLRSLFSEYLFCMNMTRSCNSQLFSPLLPCLANIFLDDYNKFSVSSFRFFRSFKI